LERLVTLEGNTHPLARPEFDQGAAPDSLPMQRILLVLQRSVAQETVLRKLLDEQQIKSSPNYHMWLTPEQFGRQFGPADADIQALTDWLTSEGFEINRVAAGRTIIEFSGTAGKVREAFHTEIHKFAVHGEEHWANASDPQIPAALQPVVAGFASLNNFPRHPTIERVGAFSRSKATGLVKPLFTSPSGNSAEYFLGPVDFATIYNLLPLWQASPAIDGAGETIAIVAETNINVQDVADFRNLFGLTANPPQIILNGPDPGIQMDETESDLDAEWSGAVAKNATIDLVVSESTESSAGVDLSLLYIIDNNLAPVMSESYSACEPFLGVGGNAFYNALHEQGAAQGITIVLSSGDDGSAACDDGEAVAQYGLAISGMASTPFNVAVGGTDFDDVNTWSTYWSGTNNSTTLASALSYIPEITWNDTCARSGNASDCASAGSDTPAGIDLVAGSGGASNCVTSTYTGTGISCTAGYPKPAWQTGTGVPNDGVRDIPDVSLFASNGFNGTSYVVCEADALPAGVESCNQAYSNWSFLGVGGTSASAPAFAGIMALVNQKTQERQGNANYVLYPLAAKSGSSCTSNASMASTANTSSCIFYDVATGNNSVACMGGSPNCSSSTTGGFGLLELNPPTNTSLGWATTAGYDLATGLGSVNATNLVNNWTSVSFKPTTTTLANVSPTSTTHGQPVSFTVTVAPGSGSGTPTGDVSLIAQTGSSSSNVTGIGSFTLSGGSVTNSINLLPGGTYGVAAHYAGDGTYGASDSTPPVQVTISPEGSQAHVALLTFDPVTGAETSSNATSVAYGSSFNILRVDVTSSSGQDCYSIPYGCPTGEVTLTDNGQPLDLGAYKLNNQGYAEDQSIQLVYGANNIAASYSGDNSYNTSASATDTITLTKAQTTVTLSGLPTTAMLSTPINFTATVATQSYGVAPTGAVQILVGGVPITTGGGNVTSTNGSRSLGPASLQMSLSMSLTAGVNSITAQYAGDSNYAGSTSAASTVTVGDYSLSANPSSINISAPGQSGTTALAISPLNGFTGPVSLTCSDSTPGVSCTISPSSLNLTGTSPVTATLTVTTTAPVSSMLPAPQGGAGVSPAIVRASLGFDQGGLCPRRCGSETPPRQQAGRPHHMPAGWPWLLAGLLALSMLMSLSRERRPACLLLATSLLVVGIWVACSGPHAEESSSEGSSAPAVSLSAASLAFGQQNTGSTSAPQILTLSNTGNAPLSISGMVLSGTNSGDFAQTSNCGSSVGAEANCTINVTFTPSGSGSRSASLTITDNASGSPQTVSLTGTGLQPAVSLSPSSLTFAQQGTGTTSAAQAVKLTDTGNTSLAISSIGLSGTNSADFAETNDCGSGVGTGGSCTIMVTFTPSATGSRTASLAIADNASGSPQMVSLTGTGATMATPPGTYQVTVNGSSNGDLHTTSVTVNVQ
jgi:hypothetical protein